MTPEQIQQLIDYLRSIGEAAVTRGFELALLEVKVRMLQNGLGFLFGAVLVVGGVRGYKHLKAADAARKDAGRYSYDDDYDIKMIGGVTVGVIGVLISLATAMALVGYVVNPEFRAVSIILGLLK